MPELAARVIEATWVRPLPRRVHDLLMFGYFFGLCLTRKIDVLVGIYFYPHGMYAAILGAIFRIPVIQILTGTDLAVILKSGRGAGLLRRATAIGCRGEVSAASLRAIGICSSRLFVLNNAFNFLADIVLIADINPGVAFCISYA